MCKKFSNLIFQSLWSIFRDFSIHFSRFSDFSNHFLEFGNIFPNFWPFLLDLFRNIGTLSRRIRTSFRIFGYISREEFFGIFFAVFFFFGLSRIFRNFELGQFWGLSAIFRKSRDIRIFGPPNSNRGSAYLCPSSYKFFSKFPYLAHFSCL